MTAAARPRVLLLSQWPRLKNAEYEIIQRIRRTGYPVGVVDFLGFDVDSGACLNDASLAERFDFAISFHYETPKFLNLPALLWVANPLEFMHSQGHYRTHIIQHLRAYDEYLYNGSDFLREQIRRVVGAGWRDSGLLFTGSCSRNAILEPHAAEATGPGSRIFYCGMNWEALTDRAGRAHSLLELLQEKDAADFYGPRTFLGKNTWAAFSSYRGEIPFDGVSMVRTMHAYGAALALSSPAHLKSRTSSGRALEGFAAGIPVISDENPHVRGQFGDLVHYFGGESERERADRILAAFDRIRSRPEESRERVREAQALIARDYCFEACLDRAHEAVQSTRAARRARIASPDAGASPSIDVFLLDHDPYGNGAAAQPFANLAHVESAARHAAAAGARVRIVPVCPGMPAPRGEPAAGVEWAPPPESIPAETWKRMRLGEKLALLVPLACGDCAVFLTQADFPHYDHLVEALAGVGPAGRGEAQVNVAGFFVNDLAAPAPFSSLGILRNSSSAGLYRWSQDSIAEHQLGQFSLDRAALASLDWQRLAAFDLLLPVAMLLDCERQAIAVHRSPKVTLRSAYGYYHRYLAAFERAAARGYWSQHYELVSNSSHELNALYDAFHESPGAVAVADRISGHDRAGVRPDPAVQNVNELIVRLRPIYHAWLALKRFGSFSWLRARGTGR